MNDGFRQRLTGGVDGRRAVWLDYLDYARRLFVGQGPAWPDAAAVLAWHRQAQGLLGSDVVELDALAYLSDAVAADAGLIEGGSATRVLRQLLGSGELRERFVAIVRALGETYGAAAPIAVRLGTPARLLEWVAEQRGEGGSTADPDDAEMAAMYAADFLRALADAPVAALLLAAPVQGAPLDADIRQPMVNVAAHYRWSVGLLGAVAGDVDFAITGTGDAEGLLLPDSFWSGETPPALPENGFVYARIPADAEPEAVLARLASLRG